MKLHLALFLAATSFLSAKSYVMIVVDDLGYMDLGTYNADSFYETPNIDKLAKSGMKFTDGYAANPVCSPTRYSLQTGRYPSRVDATNFFSGKRRGKFAPAILDDESTWPEHNGYDVNIGGYKRGGPYTGGRYFSPYDNPRMENGPDGEHLPDRLASDTCHFIEDNKDGNFFACLSFYSVHTPLMGRPDLIKKYKMKAAKINGKEFAEEEQIFGKKPRKVRILQKHAIYAAMVEAMDQAVGAKAGFMKVASASHSSSAGLGWPKLDQSTPLRSWAPISSPPLSLTLAERFQDGSVYLYNLKKDIGELKDVKDKHPELVKTMRAELHEWYLEVDAKFLRKKEKSTEEPWRP